MSSEKEFLPFWIDDLTPEMVLKANEELGETEEVRIQGLKEIRRLINGEKDFRPLMDDNFLLRFLRTKKFDSEKAFNTLRNHYTFKVRYAGIITDFKPSQLKNIFDMNVMAPSSKRMPDGTCVATLKVGHFDTDAATPEELFAACLVGIELGLDSDATQVCGAHAIFDLDKFGWRHLKTFSSPTFLFRLVRAIQDCIPVRIKGIHIVNEPLYFNIVFNIIRQLLSEKIKCRIHFHGRNLKSLHKQLPPEVLPADLGGMLEPINTQELWLRLINREAHFERLIKYGYHENKAQFIRKKSSRALGLFY